MIIDNRAGAGGNIGTVYAAKAPKDGYTLLLTLSSAHVTNPFLYKNAGFDPVKDFEPIGPVATAGYLLVASADFPANNVKELIELAKKKPGDIQYGSAGNGTLNHLLGEMLKKQADIDITHVPYKGAAAAVNDVIGGRIPISFQSVPSAISHVKSGKLKVLAVANEKRIPSMPNVPTIGETVPGSAPRRGTACSRPPARPRTSSCSCSARTPRCSPTRTCRTSSRCRVPSRTTSPRTSSRRSSSPSCRDGRRSSRNRARRWIER